MSEQLNRKERRRIRRLERKKQFREERQVQNRNTNFKKIALLVVVIIAVIGIGYVGTVNYTGEVTNNPGQPSQTQQSNFKEFNVEIRNYQYYPESINVDFGDAVKINVKNSDYVTHGINLPVFGVNSFVKPGSTQTVQFTADQRGNPETFCSTDHGEKLLININ